MLNHIDLNIVSNQIFAAGYRQGYQSTYLPTNNWVYVMKHSFSMVKYYTLSFYNNEPSKNKHFLILLSSLARNSQEPKLK